MVLVQQMLGLGLGGGCGSDGLSDGAAGGGGGGGNNIGPRRDVALCSSSSHPVLSSTPPPVIGEEAVSDMRDQVRFPVHIGSGSGSTDQYTVKTPDAPRCASIPIYT